MRSKWRSGKGDTKRVRRNWRKCEGTTKALWQNIRRFSDSWLKHKPFALFFIALCDDCISVVLQSIRELQAKTEKLGNETAAKVKELHSKLDAQQKERDAALKRANDMEALHSKLAEQSSTLRESPEIPLQSTGVSEEMTSSKQTGALPDPPSEDHGSKERQNEGQSEPPTARSHHHHVEGSDTRAPLPQIENADEYREQEPAERIDHPSDDVPSVDENRWRLSISGIWGYVTGEPTH